MQTTGKLLGLVETVLHTKGSKKPVWFKAFTKSTLTAEAARKYGVALDSVCAIIRACSAFDQHCRLIPLEEIFTNKTPQEVVQAARLFDSIQTEGINSDNILSAKSNTPARAALVAYLKFRMNRPLGITSSEQERMRSALDSLENN